MNISFAVLAHFLDRTESEVEGRALEAPPEALRARLRDFARGKLPSVEQPELIAQLNQHRHWLALLGDEVKALRSDATGKPAQ